MVTLTLPYELRALAKANQKLIYALMFQCAVSTLKDFGINDKTFAAELAMSAVLHTHSRRLDYDHHGWWKCMREIGAGVVTRTSILLCQGVVLTNDAMNGRKSRSP